MGNVIELHKHRAARAAGAGIVAAICATRHGIDSEHATRFAVAARDLVLAGRSAAMALSIIQRRIRREAADSGPKVA